MTQLSVLEVVVVGVDVVEKLKHFASRIQSSIAYLLGHTQTRLAKFRNIKHKMKMLPCEKGIPEKGIAQFLCQQAALQ